MCKTANFQRYVWGAGEAKERERKRLREKGREREGRDEGKRLLMPPQTGA